MNKETKTNNVPLMAHVPRQLREQIEQRARQEDRSLSNMTALLLRKGLKAVQAA